MEKIDERLKDAILTSKKKVRVIVLTHNGSGSDEEQVIKKLGGKFLEHMPLIKGFLAEIPISSIYKLVKYDNVKKVFLDEEVSIGA